MIKVLKFKVNEEIINVFRRGENILYLDKYLLKIFIYNLGCFILICFFVRFFRVVNIVLRVKNFFKI